MYLIPPVVMPLADIDNVIEGHIKGLTCKPGHRYPIVNTHKDIEYVTNVLKDKFNPEGYNITVMVSSKPLYWFLGTFHEELDHFHHR